MNFGSSLMVLLHISLPPPSNVSLIYTGGTQSPPQGKDSGHPRTPAGAGGVPTATLGGKQADVRCATGETETQTSDHTSESPSGSKSTWGSFHPHTASPKYGVDQTVSKDSLQEEAICPGCSRRGLGPSAGTGVRTAWVS